MNAEEHVEIIRQRTKNKKATRRLIEELVPEVRKQVKQARDYLDRVKTPYEAQLTILQGDVHISPFTPKTYVPIEQLIQAGFGQEPCPDGFTTDDAERLITPELKRRDNEAEKKVLMLLADRRIEQEANRATKAEAKAQDIGEMKKKVDEFLKAQKNKKPGIRVIDYQCGNTKVKYKDENGIEHEYAFNGEIRRKFFEALCDAEGYCLTTTKLNKMVKPHFKNGDTWKKLFYRTKHGERFFKDAIEHKERSHTYRLKISSCPSDL